MHRAVSAAPGVRVDRLDVLGYTAEEYIGQPIMKFCPDEEELVLEIFKTLGSGNISAMRSSSIAPRPRAPALWLQHQLASSPPLLPSPRGFA
jgi:hypothetical protein